MRNRHRKFNICIAFVLSSALSALAQSDRTESQRSDDLQLKAGGSTQLLLTAKVDESAVFGRASNESELPDAPSATMPATSSGVKRDASQGAPPAAKGGPLGVDGSVADRNYWLLTGGMIGASVANAELTMHCLHVHASCNDVPPSLRSRAALYGIGIPADLGIAYLTYYMKRKHSHMWFVPAAAVTGANIFFGVRAYRWSQQ